MRDPTLEELHRQLVVRAFVALGDKSAAEDTAQDVWVVICRRGRYRHLRHELDAETVSPDLVMAAHAILSRKILGARRAARRRAARFPVSLDEGARSRRRDDSAAEERPASRADLTDDEIPGPERVAMGRDGLRTLRFAVRRLSRESRRTVDEWLAAGKTPAEVISETGLPHGTVYARFARARTALRLAVEAHGRDKKKG